MDNRQPVGGHGQRPARKENYGLCSCVLSPPQAGPAPVLRSLDQVGAERVAFNVTHDSEEMRILLHGETLETPLIEMATTQRMVMRVPAHRMGVRQPLHEGSQFAVT